MTDFGGFKGRAKRIDDIDLPRIGHEIGVGEDVIHGFIDVEASGKGYDSKGRPKMLFEPHVFYRCLPKEKRDEAVRAGLAYPKWRKGAYPADSYPRLEQAMKIDPEAALKACSWGAAQILGENYRKAGFDSVADMVLAMMEDEENHLDAMMNFVVSCGLADELQAIERKLKRGAKITATDCAPIARVYNGEKYAEHNYHGRLADSMNRWAKIPDTAWSPGVAPSEPTGAARRDGDDAPQAKAPSEPPRSPTLGLLDKDQVKAIQERLHGLGYHEIGFIDGLWGPRTIGAISAFQAYEGLPVHVGVDPTLDAATLQRIAIASPRKVSPERENATADDLRRAEAPVVRRADKISWASLGGIGLQAIAFVVFVAQNYASTELPFGAGLLLSGLPGWAPIAAQVLLCGYQWLKAKGVIQAQVQAVREGVHNGPAILPVDRPSSDPTSTQGGFRLPFGLTSRTARA